MRAPSILIALLCVVACGGGCSDNTGPSSNASVASVSLNVTSAQVGVGQTLQLTATPLTSTGTVTTGSATWSTSSTAVATVSSTGLVSGVAAGAATITATIGGNEVGRQVARVADMQSVVSTMAAYVANLQRDDNNDLAAWEPATITIAPYTEPDTKKGK